MVVVLTIGTQFKPPFVEESQLATLVNVPVRDNAPELEPEQTAALVETIPEEGTSTVIDAGLEFAVGFVPC